VGTPPETRPAHPPPWRCKTRWTSASASAKSAFQSAIRACRRAVCLFFSSRTVFGPHHEPGIHEPRKVVRVGPPVTSCFRSAETRDQLDRRHPTFSHSHVILGDSLFLSPSRNTSPRTLGSGAINLFPSTTTSSESFSSCFMLPTNADHRLWPVSCTRLSGGVLSSGYISANNVRHIGTRPGARK